MKKLILVQKMFGAVCCVSVGQKIIQAELRDFKICRRTLLYSLGFVSVAAKPVSASGLLQFPATDLNNRYFLIRAGESEGQSLGIYSTNPVDKQGTNSGLSTKGIKQVLSETIPQLREQRACIESCWIRTSITSNSYQTAEILASAFDIGRSRLVPEFSFLDARGVGILNGQSEQIVKQVLLEGDQLSELWKPPKGTDGTPNESVEDVFVRCRQVLSILETSYIGEDIFIVTPDSDTLSTLQAALLGIDLRDHNTLEFRPGEVKVFSTQEF